MKATLIVIQNDADHAGAKSLVGKLMQSDAEADWGTWVGAGAAHRGL